MMTLRKGNHSISHVFVFFLLGLFAVFGTILVLLGSQAYRGAVARTQRHNDTRILQSFVRHAVRSGDSEDCIYVTALKGLPALAISAPSGDYTTYIYACDGMLHELYTDDITDFEPGDGEEICHATGFMPVLNGQSLQVNMTDESGTDHQILIALHAAAQR